MTIFKKTRILIPIAAIITCLSWQQANNPKGFTVTITVKGFTDSILFFTYGTYNNTKIDSVKARNGQFVFKGAVTEPVQAMLFSRNYRLRLDLYVDNTPVVITGSIDSLDNLQVKSASAVVNEYHAFNTQIMQNRKRVNEIFAKAWEAKQAGDSTKAKSLEADGNKWYMYEYEMRKNFVKEHPASPISARELVMYINGKTLKEGTALFGALDKKIQQSEQGKEIAERITILNKLEPGKPALAFTQPDVNDKPVSLDSYKGKYVLLEFWASWCGPCRAENPNLLAQKKIYGDKGFNILGVSLDKNKELWVKAIEKDGLTWTQVSDLNGWNNAVAVLYGIKAVPANFLIDPSGTIIAQDLRGDALNKKLKEIFP
jgi:peroxiredoxin